MTALSEPDPLAHLGDLIASARQRHSTMVTALAGIIAVLTFAVVALVFVTYSTVLDARRSTRDNGRIATDNNHRLVDLGHRLEETDCFLYRLHDRPPPAALNCP